VKGSALLALEGKDEEFGVSSVKQLLEAMCKMPKPDRDLENPFLLSVDGCYNIAGRGTVVTGTIDQGRVKPGDNVELMGGKLSVPLQTTVTGVETFQKSLERGEAGDNVGVLLRCVK